MLTGTMQIGTRFPGANWERPKFLDFLLARSKQGEMQAGELRCDLLNLSGRTVAHMDSELRLAALDSRQTAMKWGAAGLAASAAGALAGHWWGGWMWAAAGSIAGLPLAVPATLSMRASRDFERTDYQLRSYAKMAAGGGLS